MAVQRRGATKDTVKDQPEPQESDQAPSAPSPHAAPAAAARAGAPAVSPRVALNIGVHSLLMLILPLGLFFASSSGLLDPVYARTFGIPRGENKTLIGAVLAVLGVNVVIASFVISAFNEPDEPPPEKEE
ncbi:MAG: hypothetical protein J3K34DRAFT_426560 [Monoraphidium minutum]|nr:MAG: hypothetical protein J3K34DRAFT_426560 [Monoraphidium minutum]